MGKHTTIPTDDQKFEALAKKLAYLLSNDKLPEAVENAVYSIVTDFSNDANVGITSDEILPVSVPLMFRNVKKGYGRGIYNALASILESLPDEIFDELRQFETWRSK